jgi:hypothetical protein
MGPFSLETHGSFPLIVVIHGQYSDQIFTRSQTNQGVPKKYPLEEDANFTRLEPSSRAVPPSPFVSPSALNDLRPGQAASELG